MKFFISYLRLRITNIAMFLIIVVVFSLVSFLYNCTADFISYTLILCSCIVLAFAIIDYIKLLYRYRFLTKLLESDHINVSSLTNTGNFLEHKYQEIAYRLYKENQQIKSKYESENNEMMEYFTLWVHQIKTPISATSLMLQSDDYDKLEIQTELFKIEQYVNMALQYLRVDNSSSNDLLIQKYNLDTIVKPAIHKYAKIFIRNKISVSVENLDCEVITDKKWLSFVIEQILSNSLKYTNSGGSVRIYLDSKQNKTLVIKDSGIGINKEDLPRIFERGFTGYNGRYDKKSTGIGLYLCKKVLNKLGAKIVIDSEPQVGTVVKIDLNSTKLDIE